MKFTDSVVVGNRVEIVMSNVSPMEFGGDTIGAYDNPDELIADLLDLLAKAWRAKSYTGPRIGPSPEEST